MDEHFMTLNVALESEELTAIIAYDIWKKPERLTDMRIRERNPDMAMLDGIKSAQLWMQRCAEEHKKCPHNQSPSTYPSRLLELRDRTLHLIVPKETEMQGPYAALSYCWGPNPNFLQLTSSNAQCLGAGILYTELPIAFQEAIHIAKALSIHYIWIDCLCIIQSGPAHTQDWLTESANMQAIYANCFINISLARAANPHQTCFEVADHGTVMPFRVDKARTPADIDKGATSSLFVPSDYYIKNLYELPLGHRAWVLQERIMAPRVLSFGRGELFWECTTQPDASETFPDGLDTDMRYRIRIRGQDAVESVYDRTLEGMWYDLLDEYTRRRLTNPETDKLIAISAVSMRFEQAMKDRYISGHFWRMLPVSLLWSTAGSVKRLDNGVPRWSWASIDGPLEQPWTVPHCPLANTFLDTNIAGAEQGGAGGVCLTLQTYCARLEWDAGHHRVAQEPGAWKYIHDARFCWDIPSDESSRGTQEHVVALIATRTSLILGLLLQQIQTEGRQVYARVGHFSALTDNKALADAPEMRSSAAYSNDPSERLHIIAQLQEKRTLVLM
ncbi:hypothetical protein ACN47E_007573 [Coniothyrium glycines]